MAQQEIVELDSGAIWEFDPETYQYVCQHVNTVVKTGDEPTYNGFEIGSRDFKYAECEDCGEDVSESYDWDYDPRDEYEPDLDR